MEQQSQEQLRQEIRDLEAHIVILSQHKLDLETKYTRLYKPDKILTKSEFLYKLETYHYKDPIKFLSNLPAADRTVEFGLENYVYKQEEAYASYPCGIELLSNGMPILYINTGDDSEFPICSVIYWQANKFRLYIPKNGNVWLKHSKKAVKPKTDIDIDYLTREVDSSAIRREVEEYFCK